MLSAENLIDPALEESLNKEWDAQVVDYDASAFPFHTWILGRINMHGYDLADLRDLHKVVPAGEVYKLTKKLCADTNLQEFRKMAERFIRDVVAVEGKLEHPIAVQRFFNVRAMLPDRPQGIFPFHTGLLYGHGPASRSLWMPLTDVTSDEARNASMQIIPIKRSRELIQRAADEKMGHDEMVKLFSSESHQCKAGPGKVVFFTQENIHGNFVNDTGKTRVSIDFRLAEGRFGDQLARKIPGGYFEIISEKESTAAEASRSFDNGKSNVIYLNNNTTWTDAWPVHLQRYMVYEYLQRHDMNYEFELFELEELKHLPTLHHIAHNLRCNTVLYSIYALPEDREARAAIIDASLANGAFLHFVNEDMQIQSAADIDTVEQVLRFAKFGDYAATSTAEPAYA